MAESLTLDNQSEAEAMSDAGQLTAEEQDSLSLGESLVEQQESLLAGKYKSAEELEAGYKELEAKLGQRDNDDDDVEVAEQEESPAFQSTAASDLITSASDEYWNNGEQLSQETIEKFSQMSGRDLVDAYVAMSQADANY